jgi:hypothetical protein
MWRISFFPRKPATEAGGPPSREGKTIVGNIWPSWNSTEEDFGAVAPSAAQVGMILVTPAVTSTIATIPKIHFLFPDLFPGLVFASREFTSDADMMAHLQTFSA